jgi:hypothetical protein
MSRTTPFIIVWRTGGMMRALQARRESNPQPPVLETGALPIELRTYCPKPAPLSLRFLLGRVADGN